MHGAVGDTLASADERAPEAWAWARESGMAARLSRGGFDPAQEGVEYFPVTVRLLSHGDVGAVLEGDWYALASVAAAPFDLRIANISLPNDGVKRRTGALNQDLTLRGSVPSLVLGRSNAYPVTELLMFGACRRLRPSPRTIAVFTSAR